MVPNGGTSRDWDVLALYALSSLLHSVYSYGCCEGIRLKEITHLHKATWLM